MTTALDQLSDQADLRLYPIAPAVNSEQAAHLEDMLGKLLDQFEREGSAGPGNASCLHDGSLLLIAWEAAGTEALSGCRHDKISKLLLQFEERESVAILNAPPMLVEAEGRWQAHSRSSLKALITAGVLSLQNRACNTRCSTLGEWRARGICTINDMWMRPIVERLLANT